MRVTELLWYAAMLLLIFEQVSGGLTKCPRLTLKNGRVKVRARGKMAQFRCKKRFTTVGQKFAICNSRGEWSQPVPKCISRGCPRIGALPGVEVTETYNGAMLRFQCPPGTKRTGQESITCDGKAWSDPPPTCESDLTMGCDFNDEGLCGWSQGEFDDFDWTRKSGTTPTIGTGPLQDHTTGTGYYMFIESSSPREPGHVARLFSAVYPPTLRNMCFDFWYHMQGPDDDDAMGSLAVYVKPETANLDDIEPEFYEDTNHGEAWQYGMLKIIDQDENFQLVIVGTRKDAFYSDIAIDDVRIFNCSEATTPVITTSTAAFSTTTTSTTTTTSPKTSATVQTTAATSTTRGETTSVKISTTTTTTTTTTTGAKMSSQHNTVNPSTLKRSSLPTTATQLSTRTSSQAATTPPSTTASTKLSTRTYSRNTSPIGYTTTFTKRTRRTKKMRPITTPSLPATTTSAPNVIITTMRVFSVTQNYSKTTIKQTRSSTITTVSVNTASGREKDTSNGSDRIYSPTVHNVTWASSPTISPSGSPTTLVSAENDAKTGKTSKDTGNIARKFLPLIIGISAGIVGGMMVIGVLAWLWTRSQKKKKEREAAEDEMYMLSTADATGYYKR